MFLTARRTGPGLKRLRPGKLQIMGACVQTLVLVFLALCAMPATAAWFLDSNLTPVQTGEVARQWTNRNTVVLGRSNDVVTDSSGNVYTTGYIDTGSASGQDMLTAKHDSAGNLVWEAVHDAGTGDVGMAIDLDAAGNVYVTGLTYNGSDYDVVTIKYLNDGTQSWLNTFDSGLGDDKAVDIAVNPSTGDAYIAAQGFNGSDFDIMTLRYDATGGVFPVRTHVNTGDDGPVGIAVDGAGDVYVGGVASGANNDFIMLKYSASLVPNPNPGESWPQTYDSGQRDDATAMYLDANNGRIYITGWSMALGPRNYTTVGYDASGASAWVRTTSYLTGIHMPASVFADSAGNVYVTGKTGSIDDFDYLTFKYDISGTPQWSASYDSGGNDEARAVMADSNGNVIVLGETGTVGGRNLTLLFYDGSGNEDAAIVYDAGGDEFADTVALGPDNGGRAEAYIVGGSDRKTSGGLTEGDYGILKFGEMRADLAIDSVSGPTQGASTSTIVVNNTVRNIMASAQGSLADAGSFDIGFYLADDPDPAIANLIPLGTRTVATLASGQTDSDATVVSIPSIAVVPVGTYWIAARADDGDAIPEWNEGNNLLIGNAISIIDPPDLVPVAISGPGSAPAANAINLDYTVDNVRAVAAGPFSSQFVLSTDTILGNGDDIVLTGDDTIAGIAGNSQVSVSGVSVTIPNSTPAGDYFIGVIVDYLDDVLEADETNNELTSSPATITVLPIPDLTVTAVSGDPSAVIGASTNVSNTIFVADAGVSNVGVDFYLSTDQNITDTDIFLGSRTIASLSANQSDSSVTAVTIPASVTQGVYYLGAIVDGAGNITESDETNNALAASSTISIGSASGDPDLIVSDVTGPASASRGSAISVSTTVENILPRSITSAFQVGIYLSLDSTITTNDIFLGSRTLASLGGNTVDTASTTVTLPFESTEPVVWDPASVTGVSVSGNSLTKTGTTGWNAGAASTQTIVADGAIEFTASETTTERVIGLSNSNPDDSFVSVRYGIYPGLGGCASAIEFGVTKTGCITYTSGDIFRIDRVGTQVSYSINGSPFYVSTLASSGALLVDAALYTNGATINNVNLVNIVNPGTYYLGAIADYAGVITEVDENNNSAVQTDAAGNPSGTPISVQSGGINVAGAGAGSGGGGAIGWIALLALISFLVVNGRDGFRRRRSRPAA
ncbi:MAG TPA: hypothetical protein ENJ22_04095 [Gammaproteobacteria bacterium]|nr:hypothetical protein [Gammaproteobacteria bacterium]